MAIKTWIGTTTSWNVGSNWSGGTVPLAGDDVVFNNSASCNINVTGGTPVLGSVNFTGWTGTLSGTLGLNIAGGIVFPASGGSSTQFSGYTGTITLSGASSSYNISTNGYTLGCGLTINCPAATTYEFTTYFVTTGTVTLSQGKLTFSGNNGGTGQGLYNASVGVFLSTGLTTTRVFTCTSLAISANTGTIMDLRTGSTGLTWTNTNIYVIGSATIARYIYNNSTTVLNNVYFNHTGSGQHGFNSATTVNNVYVGTGMTGTLFSVASCTYTNIDLQASSITALSFNSSTLLGNLTLSSNPSTIGYAINGITFTSGTSTSPSLITVPVSGKYFASGATGIIINGGYVKVVGDMSLTNSTCVISVTNGTLDLPSNFSCYYITLNNGSNLITYYGKTLKYFPNNLGNFALTGAALTSMTVNCKFDGGCITVASGKTITFKELVTLNTLEVTTVNGTLVLEKGNNTNTNEQNIVTISSSGSLTVGKPNPVAYDSVSTWNRNTSYNIGDLVIPNIRNGYWYVATTSGTSANTEPSSTNTPSNPWPTTQLNTVVDGGVTWRCIKPNQVDTWAANVNYSLGNVVAPSNLKYTGYYYEATAAGTSALNEPSSSNPIPNAWPTTIGNTITDGGVTWTCMYNVNINSSSTNTLGDFRFYNLTLTGGSFTLYNNIMTHRTFTISGATAVFTTYMEKYISGFTTNNNVGTITVSNGANITINANVGIGGGLITSGTSTITVNGRMNSLGADYSTCAGIGPLRSNINGTITLNPPVGTVIYFLPQAGSLQGTLIVKGDLIPASAGNGLPNNTQYTYPNAAFTAWSSGASITVGSLRVPTIGNGYVYEATQAATATTGSTEPVWPTIVGNSIPDGGVTWTCRQSRLELQGTFTAYSLTVTSGGNLITSPDKLIYLTNFFTHNTGNNATTNIAGNFRTIGLTNTSGNISFGPTWAKNTYYDLNVIVAPSTYNGYYYKVISPGTSHSTTEPTWPTTVGNMYVDNGVTWLCVSTTSNSASTWTGSTSYPVNTIVQPTSSNGYYYKVVTAGTSGSVEPVWTTTLNNVVFDGSIRWVCILTTRYSAFTGACSQAAGSVSFNYESSPISLIPESTFSPNISYTLTAGTFNINNNAALGGFSSSNSNNRTIFIGSGKTLRLTRITNTASTQSAWYTLNQSNLKVYALGSTIQLVGTQDTLNKLVFNGGVGLTNILVDANNRVTGYTFNLDIQYGTLKFKRVNATGSSKDNYVLGANIFESIVDEISGVMTAHNLIFEVGTVSAGVATRANAVKSFIVNGTATQNITITGYTYDQVNALTASTALFYLCKTNGLNNGVAESIYGDTTTSPVTVDSLIITHSSVTPNAAIDGVVWSALSSTDTATAAANVGWQFLNQRWWVGGSGDWDGNTATTGNKWSSTKGGPGTALPPTSNDAVYFDDAPAPKWVASTSYLANAIVTPTTPNGYYYQTTSGGVSASTEPSASNIPPNPWPTVVGNTILDGGVTWECKKATVNITNAIGTPICNSLNFRGFGSVGTTDFFGTLNIAGNITIGGSLTLGLTTKQTITYTSGIVTINSAGKLTSNQQIINFPTVFALPVGSQYTIASYLKTTPTTSVTINQGIVSFIGANPTPSVDDPSIYYNASIGQLITNSATARNIQFDNLELIGGGATSGTNWNSWSSTTGTNLTTSLPTTRPVWNDDTVYYLGDVVVPSSSNGFYYVVTTPGTSGTDEPSSSNPIPNPWSTTPGGFTTDNTVTWQCIPLNIIPKIHVGGLTSAGYKSVVGNTTTTITADIIFYDKAEIVGFSAATKAANVYFKASPSAIATTKLNVFNGSILTGNLDFTNAYGDWNQTIGNGAITIGGTLTLSPNMSLTNPQTITFNGINNATIVPNGKTYTEAITITNTAGGTARANNTAYVLGDIRIPTTANGYTYVCAQAGTSGVSQPASMTDGSGTSITDGGVIWTRTQPVFTIPNNFLSTATLTYTLGALTFVGNATLGGFLLTGSLTRNLSFAIGKTIEITGVTTSAWSWGTVTGLTTTNLDKITIKFTNTSSSGITFAGGGLSYGMVWFNRNAATATGAITISGANTFKVFRDGNMYDALGSQLLLPADRQLSSSYNFGDTIKPLQALCIGSISGSLLTITSVTSGTIYLNGLVTGTGIPSGVTISSFGTGGGGVGTYNLSTSVGTIASTTIAIYSAYNYKVIAGPVVGGTSNEGTTSSTATETLAWPTTIDATLVDGTITWACTTDDVYYPNIPAHNINFTSGVTQTISQYFLVSGQSGKKITLDNTAATNYTLSNATLPYTAPYAGTQFNCYYLTINNSTAIPYDSGTYPNDYNWRASSSTSAGTTGWDIVDERFWIGGITNTDYLWSNASNWSLSNGGTAGGGVPSATTTVWFTAASGGGNVIFSGTSITINNLYCDDPTGATSYGAFTGNFTGTLNAGHYLNTTGNVKLVTGLINPTTGFNGTFWFKSPANGVSYLDMNGAQLRGGCFIGDGSNHTVRLKSDFKTLGQLRHFNGTFDTSPDGGTTYYNVTCDNLRSNENTTTLNMRNSIFYITGNGEGWQVDASTTLNCGQSEIIFNNTSNTYVRGYFGAYKTYHKITFARSGSTGDNYLVTDGNTIGTPTDLTINTLTNLNNGVHDFIIQDAVQLYVYNFYVSGSPGNIITIRSQTIYYWYIYPNGNTVSVYVSYANINRSYAMTLYMYYPGTNSTLTLCVNWGGFNPTASSSFALLGVGG